MNAAEVVSGGMLRAYAEAVPETVEQARAQFGCSSMRMSNMSGTACAARWRACQDRSAWFVGGDICRACLAGAARAELLKTQPHTPAHPEGAAIIYGDMRAAAARLQTQKFNRPSADALAAARSRGVAAAAASKRKTPAAPAPVVVETFTAPSAPSQETSVETIVQAPAVDAARVCPRCDRSKLSADAYCARCRDVARKHVGPGRSRTDYDAWCEANPPTSRRGPVLPKHKPANCARCNKHRSRIDDSVAGRLRPYCQDCRNTTRSQARRLLGREPTVDEVLRGLARGYGHGLTRDLLTGAALPEVVEPPAVAVDPVEVPVVEQRVEACETLDVPAVTLEQPEDESPLEVALVEAARAFEPEDEPELVAVLPLRERTAHQLGYGDGGLMVAAVELSMMLRARRLAVVLRFTSDTPYATTRTQAGEEVA